jgi:hypothetical protein
LEFQINSRLATLRSSLKEFLSSPTHKRKVLVLTGFDYNSMGDFHAKDGLFVYDDLNTILLSDDEVKKAFSAGAESSKLSVYVTSRLVDNNRSWKSLEKLSSAHVTLTAVKAESPSTPFSKDFVALLQSFYNHRPAKDFIESIKNINSTLRVTKPVLYIFPALEGDSAFFSINGYSILINGGYDRVRPCFWKFVNVLHQLDTVMLTHNDSDALGGLSTFFSKITDSPVRPNVLTVLGNLVGEVTDKNKKNLITCFLSKSLEYTNF